MTIRIDGAVDTPCDLAFEDFARMRGQIEDVGTLVSGREGRAVPLVSALACAGVSPDATHLTVESSEGDFSASVALDAVARAVLVYALGDNPLPADRGGPVRLLIPGAADCDDATVDRCANVKYVSVLRLERAIGRDTRPTTRSEHDKPHSHDD